MTNINDLMQEFWITSNAAVGTSFFAIRSDRLLGILEECFNHLEVCLILFLFFRPVDLLITIYRHRQAPTIPGFIATSHLTTELV